MGRSADSLHPHEQNQQGPGNRVAIFMKLTVPVQRGREDDKQTGGHNAGIGADGLFAGKLPRQQKNEQPAQGVYRRIHGNDQCGIVTEQGIQRTENHHISRYPVQQ